MKISVIVFDYTHGERKGKNHTCEKKIVRKLGDQQQNIVYYGI